MRLMSNTIEVPAGGGGRWGSSRGSEEPRPLHLPPQSTASSLCPKGPNSPGRVRGCPGVTRQFTAELEFEENGPLEQGAARRVSGGQLARAERAGSVDGRTRLGPTWVLVVQVVHVGDEAVVGQQEAHASQQHREVDGVVAVIRCRLLCRQTQTSGKRQTGACVAAATTLGCRPLPRAQ